MPKYFAVHANLDYVAINPLVDYYSQRRNDGYVDDVEWLKNKLNKLWTEREQSITPTLRKVVKAKLFAVVDKLVVNEAQRYLLDRYPIISVIRDRWYLLDLKWDTSTK